MLWIIKDKQVIITGKRNSSDKLWDVPFQAPFLLPSQKQIQPHPPSLRVNNIVSFIKNSSEATCNYILTLNKSKYELAQYLYGSLFAPAISILEAAIRKGNLISWPGIETINFKKYIGTNIAHEKGHLDQERQNLRSTKTNTPSAESIAETTMDAFPEKISEKTFEQTTLQHK